MTETELLENIKQYFNDMIFENHKKQSLGKNSKLNSYQINPIIVRYLSKVLNDDYSAKGVAKALYYPRILGTSINTSFGTRIQNMFVEIGLAKGSGIKGVDIEFTDLIDGRKKWCQLKAGPNTINSEDVSPMKNKFNDFIRLCRTNKAFEGISNNDLMVGVLYGDRSQLSQHYLKLNDTYPVVIGKEFWHRITGYENFYEGVVKGLNSTIDSLELEGFLEEGCRKLEKEIEESPLFSF